MTYAAPCASVERYADEGKGDPCCRAYANYGWWHVGACCSNSACEDCDERLVRARNQEGRS